LRTRRPYTIIQINTRDLVWGPEAMTNSSSADELVALPDPIGIPHRDLSWRISVALRVMEIVRSSVPSPRVFARVEIGAGPAGWEVAHLEGHWAVVQPAVTAIGALPPDTMSGSRGRLSRHADEFPRVTREPHHRNFAEDDLLCERSKVPGRSVRARVASSATDQRQLRRWCVISVPQSSSIELIQPKYKHADATVRVTRLPSLSDGCCVLVAPNRPLDSPAFCAALPPGEYAAERPTEEFSVGVRYETTEFDPSAATEIATYQQSAAAQPTLQ